MPKSKPGSRGLHARLGRAFLVQALLIGLAAVLGVYAAGALLEQVLVRKALEEEAAHFWARHAADPAFPLPDTRNLAGYLARAGRTEGVPRALAGLAPGVHRVPAEGADLAVVHVSERAGERLYLVFAGERVGELAAYFGLFPLAGVLAVLYLSTWLAYRLARRALSPVVALARRVERLDPAAPDPADFEPARLPPDADDDTRALAAAMAGFARRLNAFVARERGFTRDASHELRSPLTVVRMASEALDCEPGLSPAGRTALGRIRRAARDMEHLTEAFLLLAREAASALPAEPVDVSEVAAEEVERARLLYPDAGVAVGVVEEARLVVAAPRQVVASLIGNLVRNAVAHGEGRVSVRIQAAGVLIEDGGAGIAQTAKRPGARRAGHGVGLTIVRRLSERFGWPVEIRSRPGAGTRVEVRFAPDGAGGLHAGFTGAAPGSRSNDTGARP